ncbi:transient receptor potential cation channel subfamily M member 3-like [Stylophora pistillata]|uniref:transient receptor potential cation channel subfamily M member 3-like n=1 Tax=Stylophora pistillata TaxID=50429 RepID=UPI000C03FFB9|nr:transient receptor potential cation channel subfamily M member 3-like [Stylophora pistillata]
MAQRETLGNARARKGVSVQDGPKDKSKPSMKPSHRQDSWIYKTFKKRSCGRFIPSKKDTRRCCCGLLDKDHQGEATRGIPGGDVNWSVASHTEEQPTNAYGELEFTGAGLASRAKLSKDKTSQLHLIGIATWGIVNHREDLIDSQGVVTYHMTSSLLSEGACLDNNHSHFILVDDGTVGKYGGEIPFRAGLQNCISTKKMERSKSHGIPVVLLVLEGGPNTIQTVLESVTSNPAVPVVIAEGSGRAADILAHAHGIVTSNEGTDMEDMSEVVEHQQLLMKIQKAFPECNEEKCTALYHNVLKCVEKKRYITIFRMDAQHASAADQLSLALIWNRADIAKTEIFTEDQKWKMKSLEDAMTDALVNNRVEFVKLLLENGVSMSRFLTTTRLEELYKARWRSSSSAVLRQLIGNGKIDADHFDLSDVDNVIRRLLAIAYKGRREKNSITKVLLHFDFMNHTSSESDTILILREFKRLALDLLEKCFQENEELTQQLLTYHLENWGGQTCLSLAVAVEHEEFLAHSSCQALLTDIWTGAIKNAHRSSIKTMLGILIPPTIFLLAFKTKQELSSMPVPQEEYEQELTTEEECEEEENEEEIPSYRTSPAMTNDSKAMELRTLAVSRELHRIPTYHVRRRETRVVKLRWTRKILEFYKAPVTKFWSNVFAYMAFLVLFSFVILVKQDKIPSISEMVLIIFVCTLCTEEIRQILHSEPPTFGSKLNDWASSKWNLLDGFAVVSFFIGLGLRLHPTTRSAGHVVYCLDVMLWIIRLLHIFSVSKHLGPYVVMIGRMTVDMLYFLLIMVIFLLAYGVAQQAILYPNEIASWSTVSGVFFRPYFQVYGELFFDEPDTISPTETVLGTPRKDKHGDTIVVLIMAFYLLVANILLLNLLIAIFNNTFSSVQANANQIWKFQRYYLVMEYAQRPVLVPPFIILNHVIHILRGLYRWLKSCLGRGNTNHETSSYGLSMAFLHG